MQHNGNGKLEILHLVFFSLQIAFRSLQFSLNFMLSILNIFTVHHMHSSQKPHIYILSQHCWIYKLEKKILCFFIHKAAYHFKRRGSKKTNLQWIKTMFLEYLIFCELSKASQLAQRSLMWADNNSVPYETPDFHFSQPPRSIWFLLHSLHHHDLMEYDTLHIVKRVPYLLETQENSHLRHFVETTQCITLLDQLIIFLIMHACFRGLSSVSRELLGDREHLRHFFEEYLLFGAPKSNGQNH